MTDRADPLFAASAASARSAGAPRHFGRYQLLRLIGKSARSMVWLATDSRTGHDVMLAIPRVQPAHSNQAERWHQAVRRAARLDHPHLATVVEVGEQDRWPYVVYERDECATLAEMLTVKGMEAADAARWASQALQGLAFAHDAGMSHGDIQPFMCLISDQGTLRWMGLELACLAPPLGTPEGAVAVPSGVPAGLHAQRDAAQRDVLAFGLLLHQALTGLAPLGEPDLTKVVERLPPFGRDIVRMPWSVPRPVPEPLRAIVNRATDRQERQRYRNARTLQSALEGWLQSEASQGGGPLALLLDRLRSVGVLPALPGAAERAARLALMERERTSELADIVLQDPALAFDLLRMVNTAEVQGAQVAGSGPVLTVRRAIAMVGLSGVRRSALSLRSWPGPMASGAAAELQRLIDHCKRIGLIAKQLRPAGYDEEVVYLLALLQNLGRLVVQYHFPEESQQILRLMQPAQSNEAGKADEPGMSAEAASFAVLGVDTEAIGSAVARQMGFDDSIQQMIRRLPEGTGARLGADDADLLRATASCANEIGDVLVQAANSRAGAKRQEALVRIVQRYGRLLGIGIDDIQEAIKASGLPATTGEQANARSNAGRAHATAAS